MSDANTSANPESNTTEEDPRQALPEYQKFSSLRGVAIWVRAASRKYKVPHPTLSKWLKQGFIRTVGSDETDPRKRLIDEGDAAYCAEIYHKQRKKGLRWVFNPDGTPYIKVNTKKVARQKR